MAKTHPTDARFTEVYNAHSRDIFRVAYSYLRQKEEAENVMQDTFLKYYQSPPEDETHLKAWLIKIAINLSLNTLERRKREDDYKINLQRQIDQEEKDRPPKDEEIYEIVFEAVKRLPKRYSTVLILHCFDDMEVEQIARILNISLSATRKRLERGMRKLKESLRKEGIIHE